MEWEKYLQRITELPDKGLASRIHEELKQLSGIETTRRRHLTQKSVRTEGGNAAGVGQPACALGA